VATRPVPQLPLPVTSSVVRHRGTRGPVRSQSAVGSNGCVKLRKPEPVDLRIFHASPQPDTTKGREGGIQNPSSVSSNLTEGTT